MEIMNEGNQMRVSQYCITTFGIFDHDLLIFVGILGTEFVLSVFPTRHDIVVGSEYTKDFRRTINVSMEEPVKYYFINFFTKAKMWAILRCSAIWGPPIYQTKDSTSKLS